MKKALAAVLTTSIAVSAMPMTVWAEEGAAAETATESKESETLEGTNQEKEEIPAVEEKEEEQAIPATPLEPATVVEEDRTLEETVEETTPAKKGVVQIKGSDETYETLNAAIDAVKNDTKTTITILEDIDNATGISIPSGRNITIDFGGHTYTVGDPGAGSPGYETSAFQLLKDSTLTFKNGTIRIADKNTAIKRIFQSYADVTFEDMKIYAENQYPNEDGPLTFNNGTVTFKGNTSIYTTSDKTMAFDVYYWADSYPDGTTVIFDSDYTGTVNGKIVYDSAKADKAKLEIKGNGGSFGDVVASEGSTSTPDITISGGKFGNAISPNFLAEGLNYEAEDNGTFTYHKTLKDAQEAGGTVTQVKDEKGNPVTPEAAKITVKIDPNNGDEPTILKVAEGSKINVGDLDTPVKSRYKFRGWAVNGQYVSGEVPVTGDMTIEAQWKKKSSSSGGSSSSSSTDKEYSIAIDKDIDNGKVKVDPSKAEKGDKVTITVTPDKGYEISKVVVKDADGEKLEVKDKGKGEYTFTMPDSKVEIDAKFVKAEEEKPEAPTEAKTIVLTIDQKIVNVSGEYVVNDVAPIIRNERTMLPIRFVAKELGAEVAWDDALNKVTITKDDLKIELIIGSAIAVVNGENVTLDAPAFIENSRTYLPLRFVAENLGATVTWDAAAQQVTIVAGK